MATMHKTTSTGETVSSWMATAKVPTFNSLSANATCDVCIVGAGITGLSTAYELATRGKSVVVLDDGPIASGQTQRTTAHLANAIDDRYYELIRLHGEEGARLAAESHTAAIDRIEAIAKAEKIDCDFSRLDGYLFCGPDDKPETLDRELEAAHTAGLKSVTKVADAPIDGFDTGPALRFPRQGQFHPLKYLAGLAAAIERLGGRIHGNTHVKSVGSEQPAKVQTAGGAVVTAGSVVVATNTPINDMYVIHTKQAPYMSYVVGLRVPKGSVRKALMWDTHDPYHYVRLQEGFSATQDILIVGGEDHKTGQADDGDERWDRLEAWAHERFPKAGHREFQWSGQVLEPVDGVAFIGHNPQDSPNIYIATGDSGMGMTHGAIAGILLADLITGRANPWEKLYDPSRKTLSSLWEYAKENLNVAAQYTDWLTPGDVKAIDDIAPGSGAIVREGLKKVAVFRDESGRVHKLSASCPHLGCIVDWNAAENTWDCPCHGSRFDCHGHVTSGPANVDLPPVE